MNSNKIPCILCSKELLNYVEPHLKNWGYDTERINKEALGNCPLLVINLNGALGRCDNVFGYFNEVYNRELVDDPEEFLYRAAMWKGYYYRKERNTMFTKNDLKAGMVVRTRNNIMWLVVNNDLISEGNYKKLSDYSDDLTISDFHNYDIVEVYDNVNCWRLGFSKCLTNVRIRADGELIWRRKKIKEFTMQEIADKLNIPVDELRIKK